MDQKMEIEIIKNLSTTDILSLEPNSVSYEEWEMAFNFNPSIITKEVLEQHSESIPWPLAVSRVEISPEIIIKNADHFTAEDFPDLLLSSKTPIPYIILTKYEIDWNTFILGCLNWNDFIKIIKNYPQFINWKVVTAKSIFEHNFQKTTSIIYCFNKQLLKSFDWNLVLSCANYICQSEQIKIEYIKRFFEYIDWDDICVANRFKFYDD